MSDQMEERKMWLGFITKLNDRRLQQQPVSGATTWVLIGVIALVVYRGFLHLPAMLQVPRLFANSLVLFCLQFDFLLMFFIFYAASSTAFAEHQTSRILPAHSSRALQVFQYFLVVLAVPLAVGHFTAFNDRQLSRGFRWLLFVFGCVLVVNASSSIVNYVYRALKLRRASIPPATFTGTMKALYYGARVAAVIYFVISCLVAVAVLRFVRAIYLKGEDWYHPIALSTETLLCMTIVLVMFTRSLSERHGSALRELEEDIVLQQLNGDQIRERYVKEIIGEVFEKWFEEARADLLTLQNLQTRMQERLVVLKANIEAQKFDDFDALTDQIRDDQNAATLLISRVKVRVHEATVRIFPEHQQRMIEEIVAGLRRDFDAIDQNTNCITKSLDDIRLLMQERPAASS